MAGANDGRGGEGDATPDPVRALWVLGGGLAVAGWTAFWANVAWLHVVNGNLLDAGFTALTVVLVPLLAGGWWVATRVLGGDDPAGVATGPAASSD